MKLKKKEPDKKDKISEIGDKGEEILRNAFETHGAFSDCHWWLNKRVKDFIGDSGASEIDLIVVSHNYIYVFESKYWAGAIMKNPNSRDTAHPYIVIKAKREDGELTENTTLDAKEDILGNLKEKLEKLQKRLNEQGISISENTFRYKVVFTSKFLKIDDSLKTNKGFISINEIKQYLNADVATIEDSERFVIALIKYILANEDNFEQFGSEMPKGSFQSLASNFQLLRFIDSLPSWDSITFYGGKTIKGDVLKIRNIFENQENIGFLNEKCDIIVRCQREPEKIKRDWNNGIKQRLERKEGNKTIGFYDMNYLSAKIKFHEVGEPKPEEYSLYEIEKIQLRGLYRVNDDDK